jgi:surfeit locus 1 family protein
VTSPDPDAVTGRHAGGGHGRYQHGGGQAGSDGRAGGGGHAGGDGRGGGAEHGGPRGSRHSALFLAVAGTLAVLLFATFVALGTWQLQRRVWKLDLIARVEQRVHAPPAAAPFPAQWPKVSAATDEYRHVTVSGTFLDESQTLVQAVTELGAGYWVLTPLRTTDGSIVLVNRGFIAADDRDRVARVVVRPGGRAETAPGSAPAGDDTPAPTIVTGLLRMSEPRGAFLRRNEATANHWYSRDVQAIAAARGLTHVAPYFIDADGVPPADSAPGVKPAVPVGGLTVITFHNSHLVYAITWYTLALMVAGAIWLGIRSETRP